MALQKNPDCNRVVSTSAQRLSGQPLRWLQDALDCMNGTHGQWWEVRAERAVEDGPGTWQSWREIRQSERQPTVGAP